MCVEQSEIPSEQGSPVHLSGQMHPGCFGAHCEPRFTPLPVAILQYFGNENFPVVFLLSGVLKSEFRDSPKATRAQVSAFPHLRCFLEPDSGPPLLRIGPRIGQVHCKWK